MYLLNTPKETKEAGSALAFLLVREMSDALQKGKSFIITLHGPLGSGKTTFAKGFAAAFMGDKEEEATSPTFALAYVYQGLLPFAHLDLYRLSEDSLEALREFYEAGLDEFLSQIAIIEWPERLPEDFWPEKRIKVTLNIKSEDKRELILEGSGLDLKRFEFIFTFLDESKPVPPLPF
jgi:tRNA threonylcarbamoyl adenosine modification protein YjeE